MAVHEELRRLTRDEDDEAEPTQENRASLREDLDSMLAQMQDVVRLRWLLAAGPLDHEWNSPPPLEENNSEEPLVPDGAMDAAMDAVDKEPRDGTNISASTPSRGCSTFPLWLFAIAASLHVWNTASRGQADGTNGQPRHNSYVFMLSKWYTC